MNICVYCASSNAVADIYFETAKKLGNLIGENGHSLVYGGANVGLMEQVAISVKEFNGKITGIIPQKIHDKQLSSDHPDELIVTPTMDERKTLMRDMSDAFIALPGGFGTLEEILEVITLKQLDYHRKPIVFINVNGFFNDLFAQFEKSYSENFAKENYRKLFASVDTSEKAMDYILSYKYEEMGPKWFNVPSK
jgi:cytokinin riboside 5'-monophosphate phosphoribohydrolase